MGHRFIPLAEVDFFSLPSPGSQQANGVFTSALKLNTPSYLSELLLSPGSQLANEVSTSAQYLSAELNPDLPQRENAPNHCFQGLAPQPGVIIMIWGFQ